jgi:hypothetical protein
MILPFDYIGYKRLSENKRFPNHRWYSERQKDKTQVKQLRQSSPITYISKYIIEHYNILVTQIYSKRTMKCCIYSADSLNNGWHLYLWWP